MDILGTAGSDLIESTPEDETIDGGSNVDTVVFRGNRAEYVIVQTETGIFQISGPDGVDTLINVEFARFDDQTVRLLPGEGVAVEFETADPSVYQSAMNAIRDFDGNALGGDGAWLRIGSADVNGDGDIDQILVNDAIGRFATVGTALDGLVYFDDYSWAGETRVAGIYIDPLVEAGVVERFSDNDSQRRFQNDLQIENINRVLGADDYDGDGIQEVYFALTDGTAFLRALMHADGNIRYANYQSAEEVIDYLTANGYGEETWGDWFADVPNQRPIFSSGPGAIIEENQATAYVAAASDADGDAIAFSISGTDAALFAIEAATGVVTFIAAPDFEAPGDAGGDNVYDFVLAASDGERTTDLAVAVTVANVNDNSPVFASAANSSVEENQTAAYVADASDADGDALTYAISGTDAALFAIDAATGVVTFTAAPDFEAPGDAGGDNVYDFVVTASDGERSTDQAVAVTVTDLSEFTAVFRLSDIDGSNGVLITGLEINERFASGVSSAGDMNGDGIDDFMIGAYAADAGDRINAGQVFVIFGSTDGIDPALNVADLDGGNGFRLDGGLPEGVAGWDVALAGDVNGDGFDDIVIGSRSTAQSGYVVFGTAQGFPASIDLSALDGTNGFELRSNLSFNAAESVAMAGDFNGDGVDDLIVGGRSGLASLGQAYVVYGQTGGFQPTVNLDGLDGMDGFRVEVGGGGEHVGGAGDVNGDGFDDIIIGGPRSSSADGSVSEVGSAFVVFGRTNTFGAVIDETDISNGAGFRFDGVRQSERLGTVVANAGDINGDGFDDLIVGGSIVGVDRAGSPYVVFGSADGFPDRFSIDTLDGTNGFAFTFTPGHFDSRVGSSVASAGDINGDGFDDLIIGREYGTTTGRPGEAFVVFGNAGPFPAEFDLDALDGTDGFRIDGILERRLPDAAGAGDVNGDGYDDLVVGIEADFEYGTAIVYGGATGTEDTAPVSRAGTAAADALIGNAGDDILSGGGGADVLRGGAGDDRLVVGDLAFVRINGGNGTDVLALGPGGFDFDLRLTETRGLIDSIEAIDLANGSADRVTIDRNAVNSLSDDVAGGVTTMTVTGDAGDVVRIFDDEFTAAADTVIDGVTYATYRAGQVQLLVEAGVTVDLAVRQVDLATIDGTNGLRISGADSFGRLGQVIASAGDVNGDGFDDMVLGVPGTASGAGATYVVFGREEGLPTDIDLASLDGTNGFRLSGSENERSGFSVSGAGDVNGDGIDDLIVGAPSASFEFLRILEIVPNLVQGGRSGTSGYSYVLFGRADGFAADVNLSALDGSDGFRMDGVGQGDGPIVDRAGEVVAGAGDINGDGYDDIVILAPGAGVSGEINVVFGRSDFDATLDLGVLDGNIGFRDDITSTGIFEVTGAGDVNGDGFDDLFVGSRQTDGGFVVFGREDGFGSPGGNSFADSSYGLRISGIGSTVREMDVASAGDINGDGFGDLIIAPADASETTPNEPNRGYIVFGRADGETVILRDLDGTDGFSIGGAALLDLAGLSVSGAGDVNGDGFDDIIVGIGAADPDGVANTGASYVVFGRENGYAPHFDLVTIDGLNGFRLDGVAAGDASGRTVAAAGDVNGDGYDDLFIGAPLADLGDSSEAGEAYVWFGGATGTESTVALARSGTAGADNLVGNAGDDTLSGRGGADVIRGAAGDDVIVLSDLAFAEIDGGRGSDALELSSEGLSLDLTATPAPRIASIETIDLTGTGDNHLTLDALAVFDISDDRVGGVTTLTVRGDTGDSVLIDEQDAVVIASSNTDGVRSVTYAIGNAQVVVEGDVVVETSRLPATRAVFDLAQLDGTNGFRIDGINPGDQTGFEVAGVGDINGDGFDDVIVSSIAADTAGGVDAGQSYVVFGQADGFASSLDLASLDGTNGFRIDGAGEDDLSGFSVAGAGDFNGDGFDDLLIGAPNADTGVRAGEAYMLFGSGEPFAASIDLGALDGTNGFALRNALVDDRFGFAARDDDQFGFAVSTAGDANGDGFADILISVPGDDGRFDGDTDAGLTYAFFGRSGPFDPVYDFETVSNRIFVRIEGNEGEFLGRSLAGGGDFNGDGFDDSLFGSPDAERVEMAFGGVLYSDPFAEFVPPRGPFGGPVGRSQPGETAGDLFASSVAFIGDFNGDGRDDVIVGAPGRNTTGTGSGTAYVLFSFGSLLSRLNELQGFRIDGIDAGDRLGTAVAGIGDFNGDGYDDFLVSAELADPSTILDPAGRQSAGEVFIVFGRPDAIGTSLDLRERGALDGTNAIRIDGLDAGDLLGRSVSGAGDVNGDGYDDIIIGARGGDPDGVIDAGESYVIFGGATGTEDTSPITEIGAYGPDRLIGGAGDDVLVGIAGEGRDVIRGGAGDDRISYGVRINTDNAGRAFRLYDSDFNRLAQEFFDVSIDGGGGYDTLSLVGSDLFTIQEREAIFAEGRGMIVRANGFRLDLTDQDDELGRSNVSFREDPNFPRVDITSIEAIDLTGHFEWNGNPARQAGNNRLVLDRLAVLNISDDRNDGVTTLTVFGEDDDLVELEDGADWTSSKNVTVDGTEFQVFTNGAARLLVEVGITVEGMPDPVAHTAPPASGVEPAWDKDVAIAWDIAGEGMSAPLWGLGGVEGAFAAFAFTDRSTVSLREGPLIEQAETGSVIGSDPAAFDDIARIMDAMILGDEGEADFEAILEADLASRLSERPEPIHSRPSLLSEQNLFRSYDDGAGLISDPLAMINQFPVETEGYQFFG